MKQVKVNVVPKNFNLFFRWSGTIGPTMVEENRKAMLIGTQQL